VDGAAECTQAGTSRTDVDLAPAVEVGKFTPGRRGQKGDVRAEARDPLPDAGLALQAPVEPLVA